MSSKGAYFFVSWQIPHPDHVRRVRAFGQRESIRTEGHLVCCACMLVFESTYFFASEQIPHFDDRRTILITLTGQHKPIGTECQVAETFMSRESVYFLPGCQVPQPDHPIETANDQRESIRTECQNGTCISREGMHFSAKCDVPQLDFSETVPGQHKPIGAEGHLVIVNRRGVDCMFSEGLDFLPACQTPQYNGLLPLATNQGLPIGTESQIINIEGWVKKLTPKGASTLSEGTDFLSTCLLYTSPSPRD